MTDSAEVPEEEEAPVPVPQIEERSLVRQGYSREELWALYELARQSLVAGEYSVAERVAKGLVSVAPDFANAWLLQAYVSIMRDDFDRTIFAARQALRIEPKLIEALLFLVIAYFNTDDFHAGGTYLGEVTDAQHPLEMPPRLKKLYDAQVLRFQQRLQQKPVKK